MSLSFLCVAETESMASVYALPESPQPAIGAWRSPTRVQQTLSLGL